MTRLRDALGLRDPILLGQVEGLVRRATAQLWHTWSTFPAGTKHTPEHTQSVEAIAGQILSADVVAALTNDELAILILACHYHDLGMSGTETDNATGEGRDRVRKEHAIAIGDRLRDQWRQLGFDNQNYAEVLAEVCRGHRPDRVDGVANWNNLPERRNVGVDRFVRLRAVSAMIYAADELHLGDDRAPKREEEWKEITDAESLRHWRRHQAVSGPTLTNTVLSFDIRVNAFSFEKDIRQVFRKALLAVEDLSRELLVAGIPNAIPTVELQWLRDDLWKLFITQVCRDYEPRTLAAIRDEVLLTFTTLQPDVDPLHSLCVEKPQSRQALESEVERAVSDFATRGFLTQCTDPTSFQLASDFRSGHHFLELTARADETERLFARAMDASHEQSFYESEVGRRFIRDYVFQKIKSSYAVDVSMMPPTDALRTVIESSPTACRFVQHISAPPGTLAKHDLLQVAATAGISFDLMNSPELLLDKRLRTAIRELFVGIADRLPRFLNFLQELAIVKGLSFDEVNEIVIQSQHARDELGRTNAQTVSLNVSQSFPRGRPDWSFPYLLLAGQRAQEPITILNSPEAPLSVSIDPDSDATSRLRNEQPAMISITPGSGDVSSIVSVRASVALHASRNLLLFTCRTLEPLPQDEHPVIISFPSSTTGAPMRLTFAFVVTALRVGQCLDLQRASEISADRDLEVQVVVDGVGPLGTMQVSKDNRFHIGEVFPTKDLVALAEIDRDLPIPCFATAGLPERVVTAVAAERASEFEAVKALVADHRPSVTSVALRLATVEGKDFREEFLGCMPIGMHFKAPRVTGNGEKQEEIERRCKAGEEHWKITMVFREDMHELAEQLRQWMGDTTQPFPFQANNDLQVHYCKTRMEMEHFPHVDRFWYTERPVRIRFCPVTKAEQYRVEMEYWKGKGDASRAELLEELLAETEKILPPGHPGRRGPPADSSTVPSPESAAREERSGGEAAAETAE